MKKKTFMLIFCICAALIIPATVYAAVSSGVLMMKNEQGDTVVIDTDDIKENEKKIDTLESRIGNVYFNVVYDEQGNFSHYEAKNGENGDWKAISSSVPVDVRIINSDLTNGVAGTSLFVYPADKTITSYAWDDSDSYPVYVNKNSNNVYVTKNGTYTCTVVIDGKTQVLTYEVTNLSN